MSYKKGDAITIISRSMGPVDDSKEAYSLDAYFRQSWTDKRLRFYIFDYFPLQNISHVTFLQLKISTTYQLVFSFKPTGGMTTLALNWAFLAKIWVSLL